MPHHQSSDRTRHSGEGHGNRRPNNSNSNSNSRNKNRNRTKGRRGGSNRDQDERRSSGGRRENPDYEFIPGKELRAEAKGEKGKSKPHGKAGVKKPSIGRKILSVLTFGLMGKKKSPPAGAKPDAKRSGRDRERDVRGHERDRSRGKDGDRKAHPATSHKSPPPERVTRVASRSSTPKAVDLESITSPRLHVGNLSYETAESDLLELFNGLGKVTNAEIVTHSRTQRSKGFGFVVMSTVEEAKRAVDELHGKPFMGRVMTVGPARVAGPHQGRGARAQEDGEAAPES